MSFAVAQVLVVVSVAIWAWFLLCRGGFWRADQCLADSCEAPASWPPVAVVIPARDEAEAIRGAVRSLMEQDYPGDFTVFVVDDNSSDETADIARAVTDDPARLQVVAGKPLPGKWTGKMWAVAQGLSRATDRLPDAKFILLTDADIVHGANTIRRLVAKAEADELDLVSLMIRLRCRSAWERLLIPAFVFFFQMLYPFPWVNDPGRRTAGAAGGCMLVRNSALRRIGGISRLRDKVIDDCALARAIKPGGKVWLGFATESHSLRGYDGLSGIWDMVARTAFVQLGNSRLLLAGTTIGMLLMFVVPPLAVVAGFQFGDAILVWAGLIGWMTMAFLYAPTLSLYNLQMPHGIVLPIAGLLFTAMTLTSAWRTWRGRGAAWKGRTYGPVNPEHE